MAARFVCSFLFAETSLPMRLFRPWTILPSLSLLALSLTPGPLLAMDTVASYIRRPLQAVPLSADAKPPKIDGNLADPAWQRAAKAETFIDPSTNKPAPDQTEAFLL